MRREKKRKEKKRKEKKRKEKEEEEETGTKIEIKYPALPLQKVAKIRSLLPSS